MKKVGLLVFTIYITIIFPIYGESLTKVGTTSANFLLLPLGARSAALGGAYVAVAEGPFAIYWNPAGITQDSRMSTAYQNTALYANISQKAFAVTYAVTPNDHVGMLMNYVDIGEMDITTMLEPEGTGSTYKAANMAIHLTYARKLTDRVSFGFTAKYFQEKIWLEVARGYALDLGTVYSVYQKGFKIGMSLTNLGPETGIADGPHLMFYKDAPEEYPAAPQPEAMLSTKKFPLPLSFSLGVSSNIFGKNAVYENNEHRITVLMSANDAFDTQFRTNYGIEYSWLEYFALRAGYYLGYDAVKYTFGFGLDLKKYLKYAFKMNYAWMDYGDLGDVNLWSLELSL